MARTRSLALGPALAGLLLSSAAAIADSAPPAGQADRYAIPTFTTVYQGSAGTASTIVTILNNSAVPCAVGVRFVTTSELNTVCSLTTTLTPHREVRLCTVAPPDGRVACDARCADLLLGFRYQGHAYVSSASGSTACANIAVDPELFFFNSGGALQTVERLSLVKAGKASSGD